MKKQQTEPMNPSLQFCPSESCLTRGKVGEGNIRIHDRSRQRYRCWQCRCTFSARRGTVLQELRKPSELIVIVVTLLAYGCPLQAIVHAYDLDERTVARWRDCAGTHCQQVHHAMVEQGNLDLLHVQADEIRVKGRSMIAWMGLSMMVSTRLWLGGVVSRTRDTALADQIMAQVRAYLHATCALLVCTDGWAVYPNSICRAFREKVKETAGRGRCCLRVWSDLCIATVSKRAEKKRVVEVTRRMTRGTAEQAEHLLKASRGGSALNTAFIERLNGTMRERLASLTRRGRHAAWRLEGLETGMYLIGCTYNFCFAHHELSKAQHHRYACTPAVAAGVTDHLWSIREVPMYKSAPAPWVQPKRPRQSRKTAEKVLRYLSHLRSNIQGKPHLKKIWADATYRGKELANRCQAEGNWDLEVVKRSPGTRRLSVQPRCLSKDYERKVQTSETLIQLAMIRLLIARLGRQT